MVGIDEPQDIILYKNNFYNNINQYTTENKIYETAYKMLNKLLLLTVKRDKFLRPKIVKSIFCRTDKFIEVCQHIRKECGKEYIVTIDFYKNRYELVRQIATSYLAERGYINKKDIEYMFTSEIGKKRGG